MSSGGLHATVGPARGVLADLASSGLSTPEPPTLLTQLAHEIREAADADLIRLAFPRPDGLLALAATVHRRGAPSGEEDETLAAGFLEALAAETGDLVDGEASCGLGIAYGQGYQLGGPAPLPGRTA